MVLVSAVAILIAAVVIFFNLPKAPASNGELFVPPSPNPAIVDGMNLGSKDAPVVMQVYEDYQCPVCKQFVTTELPRLVSDFVDSGTLRIEGHDLAILGSGNPNESLELAAGATCADQQGRYWQYHDTVYWNQQRENQGDYTRAWIDRVATAAGVDITTFDACMNDTTIRGPIQLASQQAVSAGINQTPTLIVNGQKIVGLQDYSQLSALITSLASAAPSGLPSASSAPSPAGS
jgi:protein-disulfide isomerase